MTDPQSGDPKTDVPGKANVPPSNPPTDPSGVSPQKPTVDADAAAKPAGGGTADSGQAAVDLGELTDVDLGKLTDKELPGKAGSGSVLHPLQKVGYKLAILVFSLICVCTLMILLISSAFTPAAKPPGVLDSFDEQSVARYERAVELYKQLGDIPLQRAKDLFQLIVITAFLPSFTAILGYVFGSRVSPRTRPG